MSGAQQTLTSWAQDAKRNAGMIVILGIVTVMVARGLVTQGA